MQIMRFRVSTRPSFQEYIVHFDKLYFTFCLYLSLHEEERGGAS